MAKPVRRALPEPLQCPGKAAHRRTEAADPADSESQGLHTESKTFAVSKTVRHTVQPPGTLKRITAAVLVDDATDTWK